MAISKPVLLAILCCCICSYHSAAVVAARELAGGDAAAAMAARHERWMAQYGREYKDAAEKARRLEVFRANVAFIETFNAGGKSTYWLGVNQFADLTGEEFRATMTNKKGFSANGVRASTGFRYENVSADALPASVDWRTKGAVTPVKDQAQCGCCWAFSAVAAMEGIVKLSTGKLISLSEQELVDCDVHGDDHGCEGGEMDGAFQFIVSNGGLTTESNYPYTAADGRCKAALAANVAASIRGYEDVPANDEAALMKAVAGQPVSVAVDASSFQFYQGGVMAGSCGTSLDHGVTVVGYGTASDGAKYWLVKNSWGTTWGEAGYVRMEKDVDDSRGMCGIAMQPSYPTV